MKGDWGDSLGGRRVRRAAPCALAAVLAAILALTLAPAAIAKASEAPTPSGEPTAAKGPGELWSSFPLGTAKLDEAKPPATAPPVSSDATSTPPASAPPVTSAATSPSPAPAAEIVTPRSSSGVPAPVWYALVGLGVGLVCGAAVLIAMSRLEGRGARASVEARLRGLAPARRGAPAEDMANDLVARVAAYHAQSEVATDVRTNGAAMPAPHAASEPVEAAEASGAAPTAQPSSEPVQFAEAAGDASTAQPLSEPVQLAEAAGDAPTAVLERTGHVLVAPVEQGFELFEVGGDAPIPGDVLDGNELGLEGRFTVESIGPSPLDGDSRECAFLVRVA